jgi:hypothetical protein
MSYYIILYSCMLYTNFPLVTRVVFSDVNLTGSAVIVLSSGLYISI